MKSTSQKIKQCAGLIGTGDVTAWENDFLKSLEDRLIEREQGGRPLVELTEKQIEVLDRIYDKHFA